MPLVNYITRDTAGFLAAPERAEAIFHIISKACAPRPSPRAPRPPRGGPARPRGWTSRLMQPRCHCAQIFEAEYSQDCDLVAACHLAQGALYALVRRGAARLRARRRCLSLRR